MAGFERIDKATGGLRPGSLTVIAARPGIGKTAMEIWADKENTLVIGV